MKQAVIENPVLNSPFREPSQHFVLEGREGITGEIAPGRRVSEYFIPIPRPKKRNAQLVIETIEQREENRLINQIRQRVSIWRQGKYPGITRVSSRLLEYWTNPEREKPLFFCQIEALETAIYLLEAAEKYGDRWILDELQAKNEEANPGLFRIAFKMATGSGKTVVMAMLIAWQTLNKLADRQNKLFSDAFLVITPGITIRDRLRVLMPNDPENYYRQRDLLPPHQLDELKKATIVLTNYHAFQLREKYQASKLARQISGMEATGAGKESPAEMVRRVCRGLGGKKGIVVINDEAHHCYRRRAETEEERLEREEKQEADKRNEAARVWISGIEAVQRKLGIRDIYDLSATPFFLRGSGYREGDLFGWVVSDFALIDAIESGIVKVPRVPVADNAMTDVLPTYRNLWEHIREDLPRKGRKTEAVSGAPKLPAELQGALHSLYGHYENTYRQWEASSTRTQAQTPPVFIVVCNNTNVSKLVYDYIAGWEKEIDGKTVVQAGRLDIFRNDDGQGGWLHRPNTILIDSEQLDSGEAMSDEFKKVAAREIDEFKQDYRLRFPEKDVNQIKDEDLLREVMNTVGKTGKLGEQVKCVVSVSMLTEGWDANTVTHILGVRAFGTQLLCEQVVGRSLRRRSYEPGADGLFEPEYAEVFGVPFSFLPCAGTNGASPPPKKVWRVRALPERAGARISFPRLTGYRYALPVDRLTAAFSEDSRYVLTTQELATWTESAPIVGEHSYTSLEDLRKEREQTVAFEIARLTLEKYFLDAEGGQQVHLFADLLGIAREWLRDQVRCHDNTFKQLLLITEFAHNAADRIYQAIAHSEAGEKRLLPLLRPYDTLGSTDYVDFDTTRPVYEANPDKCHLNYVVADTDSWEQKMAQVLEQMPQVLRYVKNHNLGFTVPYTINGEDRQYTPDFLVHVDTGNAPEEWLNLIIEVTGASRRDKEAKVATARNLWIPAVNNAGTFGRWDFIEIKDPWNARQELERYLDGMRNDTENIAKTPGVCGGRACIRGTRIPVWTVVKLQRMNYAPQDILRNFPSLRETDLVEAQVYYALHTQEIDRDINANEACV